MDFPVVLESYKHTRSGDIIQACKVVINETEKQLFINSQKSNHKLRVKNPPYHIEAWIEGVANDSLDASKVIYQQDSLGKFLKKYPFHKKIVKDISDEERKEYNEWVSRKPSKALAPFRYIDKSLRWIAAHPYWSLLLGIATILGVVFQVTCNGNSADKNIKTRLQSPHTKQIPQLPFDTSKEKNQGFYPN